MSKLAAEPLDEPFTLVPITDPVTDWFYDGVLVCILLMCGLQCVCGLATLLIIVLALSRM